MSDKPEIQCTRCDGPIADETHERLLDFRFANEKMIGRFHLCPECFTEFVDLLKAAAR